MASLFEFQEQTEELSILLVPAGFFLLFLVFIPCCTGFSHKRGGGGGCVGGGGTRPHRKNPHHQRHRRQPQQQRRRLRVRCGVGRGPQHVVGKVNGHVNQHPGATVWQMAMTIPIFRAPAARPGRLFLANKRSLGNGRILVGAASFFAILSPLRFLLHYNIRRVHPKWFAPVGSSGSMRK